MCEGGNGGGSVGVPESLFDAVGTKDVEVLSKVHWTFKIEHLYDYNYI